MHHLVCLIPLEVKPNDWGTGHDLPSTFELQMRTLCMLAWAEPQHDVGYESVEELSREDKRELAWIAASMWGADQAFECIMEHRGIGMTKSFAIDRKTRLEARIPGAVGLCRQRYNLVAWGHKPEVTHV